jgi:hypothetical protein
MFDPKKPARSANFSACNDTGWQTEADALLLIPGATP